MKITDKEITGAIGRGEILVSESFTLNAMIKIKLIRSKIAPEYYKLDAITGAVSVFAGPMEFLVNDSLTKHDAEALMRNHNYQVTVTRE